jgi:hypothetical protein
MGLCCLIPVGLAASQRLSVFAPVVLALKKTMGRAVLRVEVKMKTEQVTEQVTEQAPETLRSSQALAPCFQSESTGEFDERLARGSVYVLENYRTVRNLIASGPSTTYGKTSHCVTVTI